MKKATASHSLHNGIAVAIFLQAATRAAIYATFC